MRCRILRGAKADPKAAVAVDQAEEALQRTKARGTEVAFYASALRRIREENHLTEKLTPIMEGTDNGKPRTA